MSSMSNETLVVTPVPLVVWPRHLALTLISVRRLLDRLDHSGLFRPQRRDLGAAERRVADLQPAAVPIHDPADDGEAEPHTSGLSAPIGLDSNERRHRLLPECFRDTGTVILVRHPNVSLVVR